MHGVVGFIGLGQMARALSRGVVEASKIEPRSIVGYDPVDVAAQFFQEDLAGARLLPSNVEVARQADVLVLAVKPAVVARVCRQIQPELTPDKLVISIAAGVPLASLQTWLGSGRVVRVMPNMPCLIRDGAAAFALGTDATQQDAQQVMQLLSAVGAAFQLDEKLLDSVTGLSGSGPAYVFVLIEALADGGVQTGLPRAIATSLAAHTVRGAAHMVCQGLAHPAELKDRVASPGGTTIAGLREMESHGVRAAMMAAVEAATRRSRELGRET